MRLLLAVLMLTLAAQGQAQTVRGAGARPCAEWSQARRGGGRAYEAEQWTLGYISAVNAGIGGRSGSLLSAGAEKATFAAIDAFCVSHPDEMLWNAIKSALSTSHGA